MTPARSLLSAALVLGVLTLPVALLIAPADAVQGQAQRLMYLHVPAAWSAYLCFAVVLVASLCFLRRPGAATRTVARAAAEVGVVLTALTLLTGSIWGALTWGTFWAFDARVASTTAMGLIYVAYLALDRLADSPRARLAVACSGVAGFAVVPLVHFSVLWWRTLHQPPTLLAPSTDPPIHGLMLMALASSVLTCTLLTAGVIAHRTAVLRAAAAERQGTVDSRAGGAAPAAPVRAR